jgi:excinuclease UvrABC ATPase subunit
MDHLRNAFAEENQVSPSLFSFNSEGACSECEGRGFLYTELAFLEPVITTCPVCHGGRYRPEVLQYKLNGCHIAEIMEMTAETALDRLSIPAVIKRVQGMVDVGLGYLTLGQPLSTLSGGECQRIKLVNELGARGFAYVLDEPTTGLHMSDIDNLIGLLNRIVDDGNTVIVVEHNLDVIAAADWVIDLGPDAGA